MSVNYNIDQETRDFFKVTKYTPFSIDTPITLKDLLDYTYKHGVSATHMCIRDYEDTIPTIDDFEDTIQDYLYESFNENGVATTKVSVYGPHPENLGASIDFVEYYLEDLWERMYDNLELGSNDYIGEITPEFYEHGIKFMRKAIGELYRESYSLMYLGCALLEVHKDIDSKE